MSNPSSSQAQPLTAELLKVPRLYQTELLEEAKKRNIIIRADTGSGKTLVACELILWMARQPKSTTRHQIQVFIVPTRPLVHQQAQSIQSGSSLRVKALTGDLQPEFSMLDKLDTGFNQIDVIVSTPKIFYDLISKGYWKFEDVSLLIFDEAHHCRKNHMYNQIMRSQYHRLAQDPTQRLPKILGMTASPIWDFKNLQQAEKDIRALQAALAAQLYEVKREVEDISKYNFKPNESTVYYEPAAPFEPLTHPPWDQVNQLINTHGNDRLVSSSESVYSELGIHAYMLFMSFWLNSLVTIDHAKQSASSHLLDPSRRKEIKQIVAQIKPSLTIEDLPENLFSSKIITLTKILIDYMENDEQREFQCIVFVERRLHAHMLPTLLECNSRLKDFIRPVALAGHGSNHNDYIGFNMDYKEQNDTVKKLHTGESNLVVATNVAEEGLDFRACRLVVRFDEITSWKGYIQSRGRARAKDSDYIVMLPTGCEPKYSSFIGKEEELRTLVYDRPLDELIEDGQVELTPQLVCTLPSGNQSILTYNASTSLLNDVCQLLPSDEFLPPPTPDYEFQYSEGNYQCILTLPPMAALLPSQRRFVGEAMPTKKDAKRSAAFIACKVLRELGALSEHFLPHREDKTAQAQDANGRKIENPTIPDQVEAIVPNVYGDIWTSSEIWIHNLSFPDDSPLGSSSMGLLCGRRLRIPDGLHLFNHFDKSKPVTIKFDAIQEVKWDDDDVLSNLKKLEKFTRVVLQGAVNRKAYEGKLFFLVAPLCNNTSEINWSLAEKPLIPLSTIDEFPNFPCIIAPIRQLHSRIIDSYELCPDLTDTSPPSMVPVCPKTREFLKKTKKFKTLGHFYKVVYDLKNSQYEGQSLVYLEATFGPTNNLSAQSVLLSGEPSKILLPLIICKGTHVPRSYWKMYSYLPSLTRILYDGCQATALIEKLNVTGTQAPLAIKALTPPGVGVPWDYQTLETVGDAFLKLATSVHIYLIHLKRGEGDMSLLRSRSVDNAYLRHKAIQANLPAYILSQRFRIDTFRDAQTENGKALESGDFSRKIHRRVLSDVVEALLGAGFLSGGVELGLKYGTSLDLCFGGTTPWGQRELNLSFGNTSSDMLPLSVVLKYQQIERKINYVFKNKLLLVQALTHRSANSFLTNCYEREEWLGDAVIDMWIVERAYHRFTNATAEELTLARAKVVSNGSLGFLAIRKLGLHHIIIHNSDTFQEHCKEAVKAIEPFQTIGSFYSTIDNLFVVFEPPKILNDVFEAIVGAVFIDSHFNLESIFRTLDSIFEEVVPELSQLVAHDPLSRLLELRDKYQCAELERESLLVLTPNPEDENKPPISTRACRIILHGQEIAVGRHAESVSVAEQRGALEALKVLAETGPVKDSAMTDSIWSKCQCKSSGILIGQKRHVTTTTKPQSVEQVPINLDLDESVVSIELCDKKNQKKRAKFAQFQAEAEACAMNSNPSGNDSVDIGKDGSANADEEDSSDNADDDSNDNRKHDCINRREDDPNHDEGQDGCLNVRKDDYIDIAEYECDDIMEHDSIINQDESKKNGKNKSKEYICFESETKREDRLETNKEDRSEITRGNTSEIKMKDASEIKREGASKIDREELSAATQDDHGVVQNSRDDKLGKKKKSRSTKSTKAVQDNQGFTAKVDDRRKSKLANIKSNHISEIEATVPADHDENMQSCESNESTMIVEVIEVSNDSDETPAASKKRKKHKDRHQRSRQSKGETCLVIEPEADEDDVMLTKPTNEPSGAVPIGRTKRKKNKDRHEKSRQTQAEPCVVIDPETDESDIIVTKSINEPSDTAPMAQKWKQDGDRHRKPRKSQDEMCLAIDSETDENGIFVSKPTDEKEKDRHKSHRSKDETCFVVDSETDEDDIQVTEPTNEPGDAAPMAQKKRKKGKGKNLKSRQSEDEAYLVVEPEVNEDDIMVTEPINEPNNTVPMAKKKRKDDKDTHQTFLSSKDEMCHIIDPEGDEDDIIITKPTNDPSETASMVPKTSKKTKDRHQKSQQSQDETCLTIDPEADKDVIILTIPTLEKPHKKRSSTASGKLRTKRTTD